MADLFSLLTEYGDSDSYPYHMPGHKGRRVGMLPEALAKGDITEIDGFDNLHQPEGILLEIQKQAAALYGAEESFLLVNGSTCGILSAISAAVSEGGRILMARNGHKSAYHGAYLRGLDIVYLYPKLQDKLPIYEDISARDVREALEREQDIEAVLVVSPTYEGRISDIREIARVTHEKGIPLIVDEAHGAHLGFHHSFAENSNRLGADLVIHSVHKTLPAMTQTALLHVNGTLIDRDRLKRFLRIYQSSSPSYILMASIANALDLVARDGERLFGTFAEHYDAMVGTLAEADIVKSFYGPEAGSTGEDGEVSRYFKQDRGKLVLYCEPVYKDSTGKEHKGLSGQALYNILKDDYHLNLEMATGSYCLAMFTVGDTREAYDRMMAAVLDLNHRLSAGEEFLRAGGISGCAEDVINGTGEAETGYMAGRTGEYGIGEADHMCAGAELYRMKRDNEALSLREAWDAPGEEVPLEYAVGRRSREFINLYPPGAPLLVPGEMITEEMAAFIRFCLKEKLNLQGTDTKNGVTLVSVIKNDFR